MNIIPCFSRGATEIEIINKKRANIQTKNLFDQESRLKKKSKI